MRFAFLILFSLCLTACANTPDLNKTRPAWLDDADYPAFLTPDQMAEQTIQTAPNVLPEISARLARLQAKADRLRSGILTRADLNRLQRRK